MTTVPDEAAARGARASGGLRGRTVARRIRRKMIALHTVFSLLLALLLVPAVGFVAGEGSFKVQVLAVVTIFVTYSLIGLTLELVVLPRQVYWPIDRLRRADEAVQRGDRAGELIPEAEMPRDELGEIMRSRNRSIRELRRQEQDLSAALARIEAVAAELKEKNDLIETARRNLADQDRLASLGMMSAGIAHEINTPLAVLKGSVQKLLDDPSKVDHARAELMARVIGRLEKLSEGLLDCARVRPPLTEPVELRGVVSGSWQLVSLDRDAGHVVMSNEVAGGVTVPGDADRLSQVFVNLLRNAVDALAGRGLVRVLSRVVERSGREYVSVQVIDDGPGIAPEALERLFEPFSSTKLDAHGTGLGLAVSEGIVREHGGTITARNNEPPSRGTTFELLLPLRAVAGAGDAGEA